jgi:PD-(D/E)XK nuclease superfamily
MKEGAKFAQATKIEFDDLSNKVLGCAIEVHRELGPSVLESAYQQCLLKLAKMKVALLINFNVPVLRKGLKRFVL